MRHPYGDPRYSACFDCEVVQIAEWDAPMLLRTIPQTNWIDASGCYPVTPISARSDLGSGLKRLRQVGAVSAVVVPDPLNAPEKAHLEAAFQICRPFKQHYLVDRLLPIQRRPTNHSRNIRRAQTQCELRIFDLSEHLSQWNGLYSELIRTKIIGGPADFDEHYFSSLSATPSLIAFGAFQQRDLVAATLWVRSDDVVYYHLGASNAAGYTARALYGLISFAIEYFSNHRFVHLGGAAGLIDSGDSGLARFKRGFSNTVRIAYLCGAILDEERYRSLSKGNPDITFFPAYRAPIKTVTEMRASQDVE